MKDAENGVKPTGGKVLAYFPLLFFSWEYYNTGSLIESTFNCIRDFAWPAAVVIAKCLNFSPH